MFLALFTGRMKDVFRPKTKATESVDVMVYRCGRVYFKRCHIIKGWPSRATSQRRDMDLNHRQIDSLFKRFFRLTRKKPPKVYWPFMHGNRCPVDSQHKRWGMRKACPCHDVMLLHVKRVAPVKLTCYESQRTAPVTAQQQSVMYCDRGYIIRQLHAARRGVINVNSRRKRAHNKYRNKPRAFERMFRMLLSRLLWFMLLFLCFRIRR